MMNFRKTISMLLGAAVVGLGCRTAEPVPPNTEFAAPDWSRDDAMYEVNVRQYTPEGTFSAFASHLPRLDRLGVDILWFMPVQPIGVASRKGPLGSYYSIANYTTLNPEFGTAEDFREVVDEAHRLGMKVILDWVGNHTAFDHPWITEHPDWYTRRADGSISFPRDQSGNETDWTDVAELNFDNADMRRAMIAEMRWWLDSMNVDGFRCDVAWGVPMDFWMEARRELEAAKPGLFMLAESEGPEYHAAFEATYAWEYHHLLNEIASGKKPVSVLDEYLARQREQYPDDAYRLAFTSNHDENSWQGTEFERMGANHIPAFVLSATLDQMMPLLYTGQEARLSKRLRFFEKDTVPWKTDPLADFYRAMFDLKEANPALYNGEHGGEQAKLATAAESVYAFTRARDGNVVLVAVNFGDAAAKMSFSGNTHPGEYTDWFSKAAVQVAASGELDVPAHGYRILVRGSRGTQ
jgi:glycosidase